MKKLSVSLLGVLLLVLQSSSFAKGVTQVTSFENFPVPVKKGVFMDTLGTNPNTLNPLLTTTSEETALDRMILMPLFEIDYETYDQFPALAEKLEVSKDRKTYTYSLNPNAKWSDGSPVTSDDYVFTFEKMMDPKVEAAPARSYFGGVKIEKIDATHFKFKVEKPRYDTLLQLNDFFAIQKKQFEKVSDFNKAKENLYLLGNGPYLLKSISRDQKVVLERNKTWWAKDLKHTKNRFNFDEIQYKILADPTLRYETFINGGLDLMTLSSDQFITQVRGVDKEKFGERPNSGKKFWADKLPIGGPTGWLGIALNQANPILKSKAVRKALAQLIDYPVMIERAFFNTMVQSVSPFGVYTNNTAPELKQESARYHYHLAKAIELLKADGWSINNADHLLHKEIYGKDTAFKLSFRFLGAVLSHAKCAQIMKESFLKAGIQLDLRSLDGASFSKDFNEKNFEMTFFAWGGGNVQPDVRQIWHSESADTGSNKVGYSNPEVDRLIDQANEEFDAKKREKIVQKISKILYDDLPYLFVVERPFLLEAFNSRIVSPVFMQKFGTMPAKDLFHF